MSRSPLATLRLCRPLVLFLILFFCTIDVAGSRGFKRNYKQGQEQYGSSKSLKNGGLFPSLFNVATKAEIYANATCGEEGPETFCKPSESLRCAVCDSRSPDPGKRHNISHVLNPDPTKWWQSPTLAQGDRFEYVTILLDLRQVYQIENVIVKAANSPRPAAWILEKSVDGENFRPWQYYAPSDEECWSRYSVQPMPGKPTSLSDDEVVCTSIYSRQIPMENGEIHTHLLNGRSGSINHTSTLQEFTQARYVKLRLQGLGRSGGVIADKRRAFYSIKEISIGGRCLCSGHASRCRYSPRHGHQECECERHTCGERCDKCCPMYNQVPWKPGTSGKGFHCEKCNCNGHGSSCRYDEEVAEKRLSVDIRGKYRGGGVCINCTAHTTGINCEKCEMGYYRPNGVPPDAPEPCLPCDHCNLQGSTGYCTPDDSYTNVGKVTGACECKPGYSGYKCDQCAAGYRQFPDCMPCPCDSRGILPAHDCEGDCLCKTHVTGEFCDRCKTGYYALTRDNLEGCLPCDCFGKTDQCTAAKLTYQSISSVDGWMITDMNASRSHLVDVDPDSGLLTMSSFEVEYQSPYWLAPKIYAGNRLSSYGSNLTYTVTWVVMRGDTSGEPTTEPNVILLGKNGMRIAYGEEQYNGQSAEISVTLQEQGWYHIRSDIRDIATKLRRTEYRGDPVTRSQMLRVLSDVKHIMIRAKYHSVQIEGRLLSAILPIGEKSFEETSESLVEQCRCPEGYVGFSCENCAWGYVKIVTNATGSTTDHGECLKCDCNGHAASCDLHKGECMACEHNTMGPKCERCAQGYYGDPTRGTPEDCKRCACPLTIDSNNFSPSCQLDDPTISGSVYVCTQCPVGYTGDHCESCDYGFFGDPMTPAGKCEPCPCNGASCDPRTGQCLECRGNTEGWGCEKCKKDHYGDPAEQNCLPCNCNSAGSNSTGCDPVSGQCECLPLFASRDCSSCILGYGNVTAGCRACDCEIGAIDGICDQITGYCFCAPGIVGTRCDRCDLHHYGFGPNGCTGCKCDAVGSTSMACHIVSGQCPCKPNVTGRECNRCEIGHWGIKSGVGCTRCGCDPVGSVDSSCNVESGECECRAGIGGTKCDRCLPGYYGFSENGCQQCEECTKPGHVCDADTGRCVCPALSFGEHCDRCRPGSYDLVPGLGCKACSCTRGSIRSQCDSNGQCPCRDGFAGLRCDRCAPGYYGYPRCRPCNCDQAGTAKCGDALCDCASDGRCPCKENAIGRQCGVCREGTFGLSEENSRGCTECFCFGRSSKCREASGLSWGQRRLSLPRTLRIEPTSNDVILTQFGFSIVLPTLNGGLNVTNGLTVIPGSLGDVTLPKNINYDYPLYWQLPDSFLGDKVSSYGGFLRFKTWSIGGSSLRSRHPLVQIQGNRKIILEHYPLISSNSPDDNSYYNIRLHESLWQIQNRPDYKVSRQLLMVALQNVDHILVKASDNSDLEEAALLEASLDAGVLTPTRSPLLASQVEICECPAEYNNTSCQDPSIGYYRWYTNTSATSTIVIDLVGRARRCQCNGRSEICDRETGYCLNCRENSAGPHCEICADSFHGDPNEGGCKPCPCPHADKRYSSTCIVTSGQETLCHCKPGYAGPKCERCAYGYYGFPSIPGGGCTPCNCHSAGSASDECDEETGQCNCRPGSTGRDCSECTAPRHVFIDDTCTVCSDNCTRILLDELDVMSEELSMKTTHIANGYIPPPWQELSYIDGNSTLLFDAHERETKLKERMKSIPWNEYKNLANKSEQLLKQIIETSNGAWNTRSSSDDLKNNIYSSLVELKNLKDLLRDTVKQLDQYGNDNGEKIGVERALEEARILLNLIKNIDLKPKTKACQIYIDEAEEFIEWLNSRFDATEPLANLQNRSEDYSSKLENLNTYAEDAMEALHSYNILYNEINMTYEEADFRNGKANVLNVQVLESANEGKKLNDQARGFILDTRNNLQDLPELQNKLGFWTEKLDVKEETLYRLNYEYEDKYVLKAVEHAQNLSSYVDQYVALFTESRDEAANPLKASQAYKNIVDSLAAAKLAAEEAKQVSWETYNKIFPNGSNSRSLLDDTNEFSAKSNEQWKRAKANDVPVSTIKALLDDQKQAVLDLKHSLNSTGIKDNQINVKLRELQSDSKILQDNLANTKKDLSQVVESIKQSRQLIDDYQEGIETVLKPQLQELKREGDSKISLASEKLTEAQSNIKRADAKLISLATASAKRRVEFDGWNYTLATKLQRLKDKIAEARNTAEGIRVSLKSAEGKKCVRSYRPSTLQPSITTSIVMTLSLSNKRRDGSLFYLPSSSNDDFVALELVDGKVRFLWNIGGGTGVLTHPEEIEAGDPQNDNSWYRIEAERVRHRGKLSVRKQSSTSGRYLPVINSTNSEFGRLDVTRTDRVWIGGIPESQRRPSELKAVNGLPGCVHQVILDGKPIGLWNFITSAPDNACQACDEGVEDARDDVAYSFNGEGYAVRNRVSTGPYNKYTFGVSLNFRTYDENALLFLAINPENQQHVMIFLREGRVILQIGYGGNVSKEMLSTFKYNNGNWTKVDAFRQYQPRKNIEKCSLSVGAGENDKRIGVPTPQPSKEDIPDLENAKYYIGGLPPSFRAHHLQLPTRVSFLGCMSNVVVQEGYDPLAEQYYGVEPSCGNKALKIVGFYGDGYLEYRSFTLKKIASTISFSFRTLQRDAVLLLSTFQGQEERLNNVQNKGIDTIKDNYYSVAVIAGQVQVRLNSGKGELILQSNNTYNDGKYHSVTVSKRRKEVELRVDDAYQSGGRLPTGAAIRAPESNGGLFFGGLPALINNTNMLATGVPLYGAIKDAIFNDEILRFDEATTFDHALIGRAGPKMGTEAPSYIPSASLSRSTSGGNSGGMSTQPEGCQKVPYYSLEPGALKFGDKPHSHTQLYLSFKKFWEKKYTIEFDFRTYYPNGLLFITPGLRLKQFLMVIIRDGQLLLMVKSKQKKEMIFKTPFNDGNWHHVVISHEERKLTLVVDSQTPRSIKVPRRMGLASMMYIGGLPESGTPLPEQVVVKLETLKGCIRGLRINGNIYDMVGSTSRAYNVGQCFPSVESGAYFQDEAYAIYKKDFELGAILEMQLEFRTSELSGVLLSITAPGGSPSLSLELNNGKVILSGDPGGNNPLYVEQHFPSPYTICDNRWHRIQAVYNDEELALKVDDLDQKFGLPVTFDQHFMASVASSPLYIGGLPSSAPKGTLLTRDHFNGCIRNVIIGGERRDWTDMAELRNIHLSSCPVQ